MADLIIENAEIYDGLGSAPVHGSLSVTDGHITKISSGQIEDDTGLAERVDAGGLALAPGIVDLHTHYDAQLTWDPFATPSNGLGVTTAVIGNCGFTIAPCRAEDRDQTLRNLTHVEGMSLEALRAGVDWQFESFPEYVAMLEQKGVVPNIACFCGHSSVRTYVLGKDASNRAATKEEVAEMKRIVKDAMQAGAVGFATSTLEQHNGEGGIPMPSRLADDYEMKELTGVLGEVDRGVFMLTKGMTSSIPWLEEIATNNGRPVMIAAMFVDPGDPERVFRELSEIETANQRNHELWGQVGCFPLGMEFSLKHPYPLEALLAWRPAIEAEGSDAYRQVLADPSFRDGLKAEMNVKGVPNRFSDANWDFLRIMAVEKPENQHFVGQSVGAMAKTDGKAPWDWFLDFGLSDNLGASFECQLFNIQEERVEQLLQHPNGAIALSDAGAHLSFLCDAGFGLHLLGHWAREKGTMSVEQAVQQLTSVPADIYRIPNRGRLVPGAHADMMLFDPATVARGAKRRVNDLPTGATRIDTPAVGLHGVWVNGVRTIDEHGEALTSCGRPGKVLREFNR